MEGWTMRDLDRLPRYNRPARIDDAEAVQRWAERLTGYEPAASQDPVNSALFVSLRDCFARACERIEEVSAAGTRSA